MGSALEGEQLSGLSGDNPLWLRLPLDSSVLSLVLLCLGKGPRALA